MPNIVIFFFTTTLLFIIYYLLLTQLPIKIKNTNKIYTITTMFSISFNF